LPPPPAIRRRVRGSGRLSWVIAARRGTDQEVAVNKSLYLVCFALAISVYSLAPNPIRADVDAYTAVSSFTDPVRAVGSPTHMSLVSHNDSRGPTGKRPSGTWSQ
jgi:hypothetical protein